MYSNIIQIGLVIIFSSAVEAAGWLAASDVDEVHEVKPKGLDVRPVHIRQRDGREEGHIPGKPPAFVKTVNQHLTQVQLRAPRVGVTSREDWPSEVDPATCQEEQTRVDGLVFSASCQEKAVDRGHEGE